MAPGALAYTYLGYAGREAASGQAGAIRKALLALALLALALLALALLALALLALALLALALLAAVAFLPRLVRRLKGRRFTDRATLLSVQKLA